MYLPFHVLPCLYESSGTVVAELRRRGIVIFAYLDDWLILGDSENQSRDRTQEVITLLQHLGWVINWDKSHLTPSQLLIYQGARIDFLSGRMGPSEERVSS